jgi:hypothetical protein
MKSIFLTLLILLSFYSNAQDKEKISLLKAPSSPASVVIGTQPAAITRPKSWEAVEASVFSNFLNSNSSLVIPDDFALEVSPYWLNSKTKLDIEKFVDPNIGTSLLQNLSFSVASTKNFLIYDTVKTDAVGLGLRTMIRFGEKNGERKKDILKNVLAKVTVRNHIIKITEDFNAEKKIKSTKIFIKKLRRHIIDVGLVTESQADELVTILDDKSLPDDLVAKFDEVQDAIKDAFDKLRDVGGDLHAIESLQKDLSGFKIEFAAATSLNFPDHRTEYSIIPKTVAWITPSWQPKDQHFEFLGVLRYSWYDGEYYKKYLPTQNYFDHNLDFGARLVFKSDRFSLEGEMIGRRSKQLIERTVDSEGFVTEKSKTSGDFQWLLNFNYRLTESIVLSYNFGKKFNLVSETANSLISVATLNFGLGAPKLENIKK